MVQRRKSLTHEILHLRSKIILHAEAMLGFDAISHAPPKASPTGHGRRGPYRAYRYANGRGRLWAVNMKVTLRKKKALRPGPPEIKIEPLGTRAHTQTCKTHLLRNELDVTIIAVGSFAHPLFLSRSDTKCPLYHIYTLYRLGIDHVWFIMFILAFSPISFCTSFCSFSSQIFTQAGLLLSYLLSPGTATGGKLRQKAIQSPLSVWSNCFICPSGVRPFTRTLSEPLLQT